MRTIESRRVVIILLFLFCLTSLYPYHAYAEESAVAQLVQSVLQTQQRMLALLTSDTFFINPVLKRVGIGTKEPVANLDVSAAGDIDTAVVVRYTGNVGHRAALILSNRAVGQPAGSAGIWSIVAGNKQTGTLGQRLGISGHNGTLDPSYKFMLDFSGNVELGNESSPAGITLYDTVTKKPYCVRMTNGALVPVPGVCAFN